MSTPSFQSDRLPRVPQVGARLKRLDDPRILTGRGRYVDDVNVMLTEQPLTPERVLRALGRAR